MFETIVASFALKKIPNLTEYASHAIFSKKRYLSSLKGLINNMPFIYRDITLKTLDHYVEVGIKKLDIKTFLDVQTDDKKLGLSINHKVKSYERVLLLGNAGIGKTTFFRHTILQILAGENVNYLGNTKGFIPIYISLKTVENIDKSPIINYIFSSIPFFSGTIGRKRFINYAEKCLLFLVIDGYDEIGFLGKGNTNFIKDELSHLMSYSIDDKYTNDLEEDYVSIYNLLCNNKVWLSSRKEFYHRNDLKLREHKDDNFGGQYLVAIGVSGLGNNRAKLIKKIFSSYQKTNKKFKNLLDHEYFLNKIDKTYDKELIEFSNNPLFLTILIYLYVKEAEEKNTPDVGVSSNLSGIVDKCLNLLLVDLDENKVLNITNEARKLAFIQRKSDYKEEKREFLNFFAGRLYEEKKNIFSESFFFEEIEDFFKSVSDSKHRGPIYEGINSKSPNNIGYQLIFSGIFVTVSFSQNEPNFDFPHRRFRELLAASYFKKYNKINILLDLIDNESISELVVVTYKETTFHSEILKKLLEQMVNSENIYYSNLILSCTKNHKENFDYKLLIEEYIVEAINKNNYFVATKDLLNLIWQERLAVNLLHNVFDLNLANSNLNSINLVCELLYKYDSVNFNKNIKEKLQLKSKIYLPKYSILLKHYIVNLNLKENIIEKSINEIKKVSGEIDDLNLVSVISSLLKYEKFNSSTLLKDKLLMLITKTPDLLSLYKKLHLLKIINPKIFEEIGFKKEFTTPSESEKVLFPENLLYYYYERTIETIFESVQPKQLNNPIKNVKLFQNTQKKLFPKIKMKDLINIENSNLSRTISKLYDDHKRASDKISQVNKPILFRDTFRSKIKEYYPSNYREKISFESDDAESLVEFRKRNIIQDVNYLKDYFQ